jgi:PAS domain S-box-containing protein
MTMSHLAAIGAVHIATVVVVVAMAVLIELLMIMFDRWNSAEKKLRKSQEAFSKAFREGPLGLSLTSVKTHRYIDVNETFAEFVGYTRDELVGRCILEMGIWENPNERIEAVEKLVSDGRLRNIEFQFRKKSGELRTALGSAELIEIKGESCVLGTVTDITDRKQVQQALAESEKRFRLMSDSAPVLMWMSGPDKLCTDFNQTWLRFTGRTLQEEMGNGWTHGVHPDDLQRCLDIYVSAFNARQSFSMEYRLRRHDGQYRWILDKGVPRSLEDGSFAGYIGCCIDISDEKQAKADRAQLSGRLIHAQEEERVRVARELHDDINQRLALLANGLEQMMHHPLGNCDEVLHGQEVKMLWQLTSEIATDIQHLSHRLHPSKLHYLGLGAAVRDLCHEFGRQYKIAIDCNVLNLPHDLDEEVSLNLFRTIQESLRNAAKHSRANQVRVELLGRKNMVTLHVSDDGIGFDTDHVNGGLGLISMRERLNAAGGEFSISSRPSAGTTIDAVVPLVQKRRRAV